MSHSKEELRTAALDIIFERVKPPPSFSGQQRTLAQEVATHLAKLGGNYDPQKDCIGYELSAPDKDLFDEIFWDLVIDRVIVPTEIFDAKGSTYRKRSDTSPDVK